MELSGKLSYLDCVKMFDGYEDGQEIPLFQDTFFGRYYAISMMKLNDIFLIKINGNDIASISAKEFNFALEGDTEGIDRAYKLNIANVFIMCGYRISVNSSNNKVYIEKYNKWKYPINKVVSVSIDGSSVYF